MTQPLFPLIVGLTLAAALPGQWRATQAEFSSPNGFFGSTVTGDQRTAYLIETTPGVAGTSMRVVSATRPDVASPWSSLALEPALGGPDFMWGLSVRADGNELLIGWYVPGVGSDLYASTKGANGWSAPALVPELSGTTTTQEGAPSFRGDGLEVFFETNRRGPSFKGDIYRATRPDLNSPWATPVLVSVSSTFGDRQPAISPDGLKMIFASDRPGTLGGDDHWIARRPDINSPFRPVEHLPPPLSSTRSVGFGSFGPDGFSFRFLLSGDVVRSDFGLPRTLQNAAPQVGQMWTVSCRHDPAGSGVLGGMLLSGASTPAVPVAGVAGRLFLAPPITLFNGPSFTDPMGRVSLSFVMPALAGLPLNLQSFAIDTTNTLLLGDLLSVTVQP